MVPLLCNGGVSRRLPRPQQLVGQGAVPPEAQLPPVGCGLLRGSEEGASLQDVARREAHERPRGDAEEPRVEPRAPVVLPQLRQLRSWGRDRHEARLRHGWQDLQQHPGRRQALQHVAADREVELSVLPHVGSQLRPPVRLVEPRHEVADRSPALARARVAAPREGELRVEAARASGAAAPGAELLDAGPTVQWPMLPVVHDAVCNVARPEVDRRANVQHSELLFRGPERLELGDEGSPVAGREGHAQQLSIAEGPERQELEPRS
mmetsp:Transcript_53860/g.108131  ORF Transcript_53860/g.108131 Transcript_53860/m.108131 type:complete len:265 (+) Transcript_53860:932-1726(+)